MKIRSISVSKFEPVDENESSKANRRTPASFDASSSNRLQDAELQKMTDQGKCLSMHQPYASLLVAGIKKYVSTFLELLQKSN
jgi:activating signal cointegrator 1